MKDDASRSYSLVLLCACCISMTLLAAAATPQVGLYDVYELEFTGPTFTSTDCPARDVDFYTTWRHQSGSPTYTVYGFWDGGNSFKVRFCPTRLGQWSLTEVASNKPQLRGRKQGFSLTCVPSSQKGFWIPDEGIGRRWYKRSDGSHQYIFGNTMYTFLSEYTKDGPSASNIKDDVINNSKYFKKIRFSIMPCRYPNPAAKPFLDNDGNQTDDGNFSHRPNPAWFSQRVDLAVQTAFQHDLIADMILNGPDTVDARSVLAAGANNGDCTPLLRYIAARYGSYPNVWICLANEFDIKNPKYSTDDIVRFGTTLRKFLPCQTPVSIHSQPGNWNKALNERPWHDHVILQKKIKTLAPAADLVAANYALGGNTPVIDDELAYEGDGDGWSEADVIQSHLGAFMGAGYGTTGHKPASKEGHYFWGSFDPRQHHAADNLKWLRDVIDDNITFWKMTPAPNIESKAAIFTNLDKDFRAMQWPGHEYVLATNKQRRQLKAHLPDGKYRVTRYDVIAKDEELIAPSATGTFVFDSPPSRAVLFHFAVTE